MKNTNGIVPNVKCCNCGEIHDWNEETCEIYRNDYLCNKCLQEYFGYCNECGELNKYENMNDDIICKECEG